jgi:hypothetical protein
MPRIRRTMSARCSGGSLTSYHREASLFGETVSLIEETNFTVTGDDIH